MATNDQWMRDYTCDICHTAGIPVHQRNNEGWTCGLCYRNRIADLEEAAQELVSLADTDWYDTVQTLADLVGMKPTWVMSDPPRYEAREGLESSFVYDTLRDKRAVVFTSDIPHAKSATESWTRWLNQKDQES